ncbi:MAG: hypothetical protein RQ729_11845 [Wenzhouxiangellaceae bacterium]|nr:hypothetical protein [Wenzhouxiangellaceae bacterium]
MSKLTRILQSIALALLALVLAGCPQKREDLLREETLQRFEAVVRWNQFDSIIDFIHPDWLEEHPVSDLDIERLHQFRVSQYRLVQVMSLPDGSGFDRLIQLRMTNRHTARERLVEYTEAWRWDEERKRWMLHSPPPDPSRSR